MSALICISKISNACVWIGVDDFICNVRSQPNINIYISPRHRLGSTNFHAIPYETGTGTRTTVTTKIESAFRLESIFPKRLCVRHQALCTPTNRYRIHWLAFFAMCIWFACTQTDMHLFHMWFSLLPIKNSHTNKQTHANTHTHKAESKRQATSIRFLLHT